MYLNNRLKFIIFFSAFMMLIFTIDETYGKYKSEASGNTTMSIARWNINVNSQDIISNEFISNTLTPYFLSNDHVSDGVIAPGAVGYFDLVLDCTNVDVSFEYKISTNINIDSSVLDLKVIGYSVDGGAIIDVDGSLNEVGRTVLLSDLDKYESVRVYVSWSDLETDNMDNAADTTAALSDIPAKMDVIINFTQIIE